jgi:hypothetical protein
LEETVMPETMERIGKFDVRVAFASPAEDEDYRQRRVDALTAWLLAQWESQRKEDEHGDALSAG